MVDFEEPHHSALIAAGVHANSKFKNPFLFAFSHGVEHKLVINLHDGLGRLGVGLQDLLQHFSFGILVLFDAFERLLFLLGGGDLSNAAAFLDVVGQFLGGEVFIMRHLQYS